MPLPTCECVGELPQNEKLSAIYCALYTLSQGDVDGPYLLKSANLSDVDDAGASRTNLGGTTVGQAFFTVANPGAITFPRVNADNSVTLRSAANIRADIGAAASGANSDITSLSGLTTPLSVAQGGTGITAYGHRARVRTPGTGSHLAVANNTITKLTVFTNELEDANGLWTAASSQTAVIPAGGYQFMICVAADTVNWELFVYDDGVVTTYPGFVAAYPGAHPSFSGVIVADGTSVYDFRVRQQSGSPANIYDDTSFMGLVLIRIW